MLRALLPDAQLDVRLAERRLQLLVLVGKCPLTLVRLQRAVRGETGHAAFEELPLHKPIFVFNRENRRTCHAQLPSRGARH
jgi:hypothetical protein